MKLLIPTWFDCTHLLRGGAEVYLYEAFGRLVARGHQIPLLGSCFDGCHDEDVIDRIRVIRRGHPSSAVG